MNTILEHPEAHHLIQERPRTYLDHVQKLRKLPILLILQLGGFLAAAVGLCYLLLRFSPMLASLGAWGYVGVAAVEFSNSVMLVFPTPAAAYTFAMGAVLNPLAVAAIGGVFATMGELVGYALGRRGSRIVPDHRMIVRLREWTERWGAIVLFLFAALPLPFDFVGIWAGTARYPLTRFVPIVLLGKTLKTGSIALAGYFGLNILMGLVH